MKIVRVETGNSGVAKSCLGGCLLLLAWVGVGVVNIVIIEKFQIELWQATITGIVWLLSGPVCGVAYFRWRGQRHSRAFGALEQKMAGKARERLKKESPDP